MCVRDEPGPALPATSTLSDPASFHFASTHVALCSSCHFCIRFLVIDKGRERFFERSLAQTVHRPKKPPGQQQVHSQNLPAVR